MAKVNVGIVVKADGTVPFDKGVHPTTKQKILSALADDGHEVNPVTGTSHYKIKAWPPVHVSKLFTNVKAVASKAEAHPAVAAPIVSHTSVSAFPLQPSNATKK